jgi:lipoic acid synthetase
VAEFVSPERFEALRQEGLALGFRYVASGPLVRSSYRAAELFLRGELESRATVAGEAR